MQRWDQLAFLFPGEGSIYLWTYKAFGPFASFFAGFAAWWPGVLVMLSTGTAVSAYVQYLGNWSFPPWLQGVVILVVITIAAVLAALRFRVTQNAVNVIFVLYGLAILLVGLSAVLWLAQGHHSFTDFSHFNTSAGGWFQGINNNPLDLTSATSSWRTSPLPARLSAASPPTLRGRWPPSKARSCAPEAR